MTTDIKLLPLPELPVAVERFILSSLGPMKRKGAVTALRTMLREYARSNVAPLQTEIEALRAEVERWMVPCREWLDKTEWVQQTAKLRELGHHRADILRQRIEQAEARAERLSEALRDLLDQLEGVGIYIPGEDSGQWAGTEGISFTQAEAALQPL